MVDINASPISTSCRRVRRAAGTARHPRCRRPSATGLSVDQRSPSWTARHRHWHPLRVHPGVHLGDDGEARAQARAANELCAALVKERPDRFGFFASLPLPDVDGALAEAANAFDVLQADGVVLLANVRVLPRRCGLPALRRSARAARLHPPGPVARPRCPRHPTVCRRLPLDTTRAAINLVTSDREAPGAEADPSHAAASCPTSPTGWRSPAPSTLARAAGRATSSPTCAGSTRHRPLGGPVSAQPARLADPTHILRQRLPFATPETVAYFNGLETTTGRGN
jgi:hypothetical protein